MNNPAFEINGQLVTREAFYAVACDPSRSVAVEACAGAGKTWMLVSRILRALLLGCAPHEILAITFTKRAAGEMRKRLHEWLEEFSNASVEKLQTELHSRGFNAKEARDLCEPLKGLHAQLLAADRPVQIRTFHSWFAALLRAAPLSALQELELPPNYELLEEDAQAVQQVWRRFYAALLKNHEAHLDFEAMVNTHGRFQTEKALATALARRVEFALADASGRVLSGVPSFKEAFADLAQYEEPLAALVTNVAHTDSLPSLHSQLVQAAIILGRASQPSYSAKGQELEMALTNSDALGVVAALLTQAGTARKFGDKVTGIEQVRAVQAQVVRVLAAQLQFAAWQHQQRMTRLTRVLIAEYSSLKRERGWVDMSDVEWAGRKLLEHPVWSGWVQERLDASIGHLLIDEFQDTNPLQWHALLAWLSGYAGAGGGAKSLSVFIVGDPKQSIYRFRRAEPQVFIAAKEFVAQQLGGALLSCDHTRRNALAVTACVNHVMAQAQQAGDLQDFRLHTTQSQAPGVVQGLPPIPRPASAREDSANDESHEGAPVVWRDSLHSAREVPEETLRSLECQQAAQWLAHRIASGLPPGDIMVLARQRDRLVVMEEALRALHVPTQQPEKTVLGEMPEVQDMVALLDALVSPAHDLSLARALKSPLFSAGDDALIALASAQRALAVRKPWLEILQTLPAPAPTLQGVAATLHKWQGWLHSLPPHDALNAIYADADVLAKFAAAAPASLRQSVLANLRALLSAALQLDGARYATPYAFIRALKAGSVKAPARAQSGAVQLLTVHGAKGLEAPLVLMLDTDGPPPNAQSMGVLIDWPGQAKAPQSFVFLASETNLPQSAAALMVLEAKARAREEINVLYVALTRAKQELVLSCVQPRKANAQSAWQRLQEAGCTPLVLEAAVELDSAAELVQCAAGIVAPQAPFYLQVLPLLKSKAVPVQTALNAVLAVDANISTSALSRMGQAMHRLLEWAPLGAQDFSVRQLQQVAQAFALDAEQTQQARTMAQRILQGEGAWVWDAAQVQWQGNEVSLSAAGRIVRIDRLVQLKSNIWWVLDYKSAANPNSQAEHVAQLRGYLAAVQAIYPSEKVQAAFLTASGALEMLGPEE